MPIENYNEYRENNSESMKTEIDTAIRNAQLDLNNLRSDILSWNKKVEFQTPSSINNFYRIEWNKIVFNLNEVKNYLQAVYKRLLWMKVQKFSEISKENNFKWTILAIQIALKAIDSNKYNIWKFNGEYNEATKQTIKQFQTDNNLTWHDWKPWKETIWKLVEILWNSISNKRIEKSEVKSEKDRIREIVEEAFQLNLVWSWLFHSKALVDRMVDYIADWNLWTNKDEELENDIKALAWGPFKSRLKELINNDAEKKWWSEISDRIFQQLLVMEGGQWYKASVHREFKEKFPTWPYWMVYKHIDSQGRLLKKEVPFRNWERVSKEWALNNAKAYYNKRAQEWKELLDWQWCQYNQAQLDSLVSASWWKQEPVKKLKNFVISHWNDKQAIFNYISNFAVTASGKVLWWLVARRQLEANRFMWKTDKTYAEYQREYQEKKPKKRR